MLAVPRRITATAKVSSIKSFKARNLLGQHRGTACQDLLCSRGVNSSLRMPPASHALLGRTAHLLHPRQARVGSRARSQRWLTALLGSTRGLGPLCLTTDLQGHVGQLMGGTKGETLCSARVWVAESDPAPHFPHELPLNWALQKA